MFVVRPQGANSFDPVLQRKPLLSEKLSEKRLASVPGCVRITKKTE